MVTPVDTLCLAVGLRRGKAECSLDYGRPPSFFGRLLSSFVSPVARCLRPSTADGAGFAPGGEPAAGATAGGGAGEECEGAVPRRRPAPRVWPLRDEQGRVQCASQTTTP